MNTTASAITFWAQGSIIENVYYVAGIVLILSVAYSASSYALTRKKIIAIEEKEMIKEALAQAHLFRTELIVQHSWILNTITKIVDNNHLKIDKIACFKDFTRDEMKQLFGDAFLKRVEPDNRIQYKAVNNTKPSDIDYGNLYSAAMLPLNLLEQISIAFISGIADEETAYLPLHVVFIRSIEAYYPFISYMNKNPENKVFNNCIALYHLWKDREEESKNRVKEVCSQVAKPKTRENKLINTKKKKRRK